MTTVDRGLDAPSAIEGERLMAPQPKPAGRPRRRTGGFTPYAVSNIQPQTIVEVSAGMAHASSMPTESRSRNPFGSRVSIRAMRVAAIIVMITQAAAKTIVRASTAKKTGSVSTFV